jgi:hypothetical protein
MCNTRLTGELCLLNWESWPKGCNSHIIDVPVQLVCNMSCNRVYHVCCMPVTTLQPRGPVMTKRLMWNWCKLWETLFVRLFTWIFFFFFFFFSRATVRCRLWLPIQFRLLNKFVFTRLGCQPNAQPPTWRTRVSLLVWNLTLDLSGLGDPTTSTALHMNIMQTVRRRMQHGGRFPRKWTYQVCLDL